MRRRISLEIFSPVANLMLAGPTRSVGLIIAPVVSSCTITAWPMIQIRHVWGYYYPNLFSFQLHAPANGRSFYHSDKIRTQSSASVWPYHDDYAAAQLNIVIS